jgi:hypothetical protein
LTKLFGAGVVVRDWRAHIHAVLSHIFSGRV